MPRACRPAIGSRGSDVPAPCHTTLSTNHQTRPLTLHYQYSPASPCITSTTLPPNRPPYPLPTQNEHKEPPMPGSVHSRRNQPICGSPKEMRLSCTPMWLIRAECEEGRTAASTKTEQSWWVPPALP